MEKPKRSQLKKDFFSGKINLDQFKVGLEESFRYRGLHMKPGKNPKWSGPFRDTRKEADDDNAPFFDSGYQVDVYIEQS